MLEVKNLSVAIDDHELLHNLSFNLKKGETTYLLGPNGAGKSTLAGSIAGLPKFQKTNGKIIFNKKDLSAQPLDSRARSGIFLSFQDPVEVPGLSTYDFLRSALEQNQSLSREEFESRLDYARKLLKLDPFFAKRDLNVGFSGGEKKKNEALQLITLRPKLAILDELDSGLDVDSAKLVSSALKQYQADFGCTFLVITHSFRLSALPADRVLILNQGRLVREGGPELIKKVSLEGFKECEA